MKYNNPSNYDFTIDNEQNDLNTIRREALDGKSGYIDFNSVDKTLYVTAQCTGENTERNFVVGSLVTFTNGLADISAPIKYIIQGIIEILLSMTGFMITSLKQQI